MISFENEKIYPSLDGIIRPRHSVHTNYSNIATFLLYFPLLPLCPLSVSFSFLPLLFSFSMILGPIYFLRTVHCSAASFDIEKLLMVTHNLILIQHARV